MSLKQEYNPNITIHPGITLREMLKEIGMFQVELAKRTGLTLKTINEIVRGKNPITAATALKLSAVFGMSANFWSNLQRNYKQDLLRLRIEQNSLV
ncbi:MAG: HigA family addiction module antidote protein [Parcubacteria group bacterium]|nr:HigA family addiction module antidote protein [Parcubacteria group bacterium]